MFTSLNILECCGANSFSFSTESLQYQSSNDIKRGEGGPCDSPDLLSEANESIAVAWIEPEFGFGIDGDTSVEFAASKHHGGLDMRILI